MVIGGSVSPDPVDRSNESKDEMIQKEVVVLGRHYLNNPDYQHSGASLQDISEDGAVNFFSSLFNKSVTQEVSSDFLDDVKSKLNFTYRTRFKPIPRDPEGPSPFSFYTIFRDNPINTIESAIANPDCFSTDIGWGCMIRTGQSLLGNALIKIKLGRDYRFSPDDNREEEIIRLFNDTPNEPFSLHNFVDKGKLLSNMKPGEWFGPSATSRSIQRLVHDFPECGIDNCVISISSGDIYLQDVKKIFKGKKNSKILFLLAVKLGINSVNSFYWSDILEILGSEYSVGIAGGRPSSSLYFFGYENDNLLYFDPHSAQPSLEVSSTATCHSTRFGKLSLADLDPSMLIGILVEGEDEWLKWKEEVANYKIINILDTCASGTIGDGDFDVTSIASQGSEESINAISKNYINDYVDVGQVIKQQQQRPLIEDDKFQDVLCKKQKIMVMPNRSCSSIGDDQGLEVERVLVEHETTPID